MQQEIPHWDFNQTQKELTAIWEKHLSAIEVETPDQEAKEKFYGAFYRASFLPRTFNDVDGRYPAFAQKIRFSNWHRMKYTTMTTACGILIVPCIHLSTCYILLREET